MSNSIQTIAPLLADSFVDADDDSGIFEKNEEIVRINESRLGLYHKYIGHLHDSWILKTELTTGKFSLLLNDFATHVFADAIVAEKGLEVEPDKLIFPPQIDFEITDVSFNAVDESGMIKTIDPVEIDEYLDEQIISCNENSIKIGLVVWQKKDARSGQSILILIDAKNMSVIEGQENAWRQVFNNEYINYYQYFKSQFLLGRYLSDQTICKELIGEYDNRCEL